LAAGRRLIVRRRATAVKPANRAITPPARIWSSGHLVVWSLIAHLVIWSLIAHLIIWSLIDRLVIWSLTDHLVFWLIDELRMAAIDPINDQMTT
jgi:hypothetical protein